ncbi:MAG TPA: hypothetical protein VLG69_04145, partial [Candidatus Andersenbacteria bacterium]|nr:hypothetical protein [Candidatus Andersenbacteria bacterium]
SSTRKQRRKGRRKHHNTNNGLFPRAQVVAESRSDAELGSIVRRLFATLMGQPMVSECPSSVKILSAIADKEYSAGDMPFILSKANFRDVDSKDWSKDDILRFQNFANLVLELSRKCLLIVAQLSKENLRDELIRRLGKNLDMLWSTYKVAASVAPIEYIQDIELSKRV